MSIRDRYKLYDVIPNNGQVTTHYDNIASIHLEEYKSNKVESIYAQLLGFTMV